MVGIGNLFSAAVLCVCFGFLASTNAASPCRQVGMGLAWMGDSDDCSKFYICAFGMSFPMTCGDKLSWQPKMYVCCHKGSSIDTCTKLKQEKAKIETFIGRQVQIPKTCQPGMTDRLPHPDNCAHFYDCAAPMKLREMSENYERECPYPQVFNATTMKCDHYTEVDCGQKIVPRNRCDYQMNQCTRAHCKPCNVRFASCDGLEDGVQAWRGKEGSRFYCECKNQRVVRELECPRIGNKFQAFNSQSRKCVDPEL